MIDREDPGVQWLLASPEPAVRALTLKLVLGYPHDDPAVVATEEHFADGSIASALLRDNGAHVYAKWQGQFWRLSELAELDVPSHITAAHELLDMVLNWLASMNPRKYPPVVADKARAHACWQGNALLAAVVLDRMADAADLAERLVAWQWPDGGWNCDRRPGAGCSSVHESFGAFWGLSAFARVGGDAAALDAAQRAAEFFLERKLFRSRRTNEVIDDHWLRFRHPTNYHYDVLHGLWIFARCGLIGDPRLDDALALVAQRRRADGLWDANGRWWKPPGGTGPYLEVADWGPSRGNALVTLKALTVLAARERVAAPR